MFTKDESLSSKHDFRSFFPEVRTVHSTKLKSTSQSAAPLANIESIFDFRADNRQLSRIPGHEKDSVPNFSFEPSDLNQDPRPFSFGPTIASPFGSMETDDPVQNARRLSISNAIIQDSFHSLFSGVRNGGHLKNDDELQALQILLTKQSEVQSGLHSQQPFPCAAPSRSSSDSTSPLDSCKHTTSAPAADDSDGAGRRSYRQQTSELINKLDKLLDFRQCKGPSKRKKSGEKRQANATLLKPRARNVVLKVATELIRRMQLDDQVRAMPMHSFMYLSAPCDL